MTRKKLMTVLLLLAGVLGAYADTEILEVIDGVTYKQLPDGNSFVCYVLADQPPVLDSSNSLSSATLCVKKGKRYTYSGWYSSLGESGKFGTIVDGDGPLCVTATLKRIDNIDKTVTVKFSDDSDDNIFYGSKEVTLHPGQEKAIINLGPKENSIMEGERTYNISAAVYVSSCSCSAATGTSKGTVTVPLKVYDNDGPSISIRLAQATIPEGAKTAATVTRNKVSDHPLTITLTTDHPDDITIPQTVVIPAAEKHDSYRRNMLVDPGKDNVNVVNLSFNPISVNWNVTETEVKDDDKSLAYSVSRKKWFGTLADDGFRNDVMYKMYSKNNQLLRVNGLLMTESEPITIEKGWNYIPYQPQQDATLSVALSV